jgi:hypothetical protein
MPSEWDDALEGLGLVTPDNSADPFASEKFANPAVSSALEGAGALVAAPGKLAAPNPYPAGSEEAVAYERFRESTLASWAPQMALGMLGGGTGFVRSGSGELALGAAGASKAAKASFDISSPDPTEAALAQIEQVLKGEKPAESALPSNKGYTLSSAANPKFPESAEDYFVHDPSGAQVGQLTKTQREVTDTDEHGNPTSWTPAGWSLDMPGVAPKGGTSLEDLMHYIPNWHKGAIAEALPEGWSGTKAQVFTQGNKLLSGGKPSALSDADIEKSLASNPGASIFDLAGVTGGPSSAVKKPYSGYETTQFHNLGSFPQEVPYAPPPPGLAQGYLTPAVHGTRLGEAIWETPGGVASDLGGLGAAHSQGLDALRLPPDELGVHFGTPEQAHHFTSTVTGGGYLPRTYPTVLQTGKSLELPDTGTWHVQNIQSALDSLHAGSGYGVDSGSFTVADPEAHIGEFPASERQNLSSIEAMRDYLASKGYDSVNYINKVEGPGQRSYIMFKPSAENPGFVSGVRSRFAKFDPSRVASPLLAAGVAGAAASPVLFDEKSKPYVLTK